MRKPGILSALAALTLLLTGCGTNTPAEPTQTAAAVQTAKTEKETEALQTVTTTQTTTVVTTTAPAAAKELVILGDSISYGYGLDNIEAERYSALLAKGLGEKDRAEWTDCNYAVSGDTSSDLLKILKENKAEKLPDAEAVVICIGGNNLLQPLKNYFQETAGNLQKNLNNLKGLKKDSISDYSADDLKSFGGLLINSVKDIGIDYDNLQTDIDNSLRQMKSDLEEIYRILREKNSKAAVYVMNVYNPYKNLTDVKLPGMEEPFNLFGQKQIDNVNKIISDWENAHSDLIAVDLAAEYAKYTKPPIIGKKLTEFAGTAAETTAPAVTAASGTQTTTTVTGTASGSSTETSAASSSFLGIPDSLLIDPHPNAEGQRIIADLLLRTMRP